MTENQTANVAKSENNIYAEVFCAYDEIVAADELKANPLNPNTHPEEQIKYLLKPAGVHL